MTQTIVTLTNARATKLKSMRYAKASFYIDIAQLRAAGCCSRGNMECKVKRFERNTDLTIKNWIGQIKTYSTIGKVFPKRSSALC